MGLITWLRRQHARAVAVRPENRRFPDAESFFEWYCVNGDTGIRPGQPCVAYVSADMTGAAASHFGKTPPDGSQILRLSVACRDRDIETFASHLARSGALIGGDLVAWVPTGLHPLTGRWTGVIVASLEPELTEDGQPVVRRYY
jgi:hypothetical protein